MSPLYTYLGKLLVVNGKLTTDSQCCCNEYEYTCDCTNCECSVTVTYANIVFPADGLLRTICIGEPFGEELNLAWMSSASATIECDPVTKKITVILTNRYSGIANNAFPFPEVGDVCDNLIGSGFTEAVPRTRKYAWSICDVNGCPQQNSIPELISVNSPGIVWNNECSEEYDIATRTEPSFAINCT